MIGRWSRAVRSTSPCENKVFTEKNATTPRYVLMWWCFPLDLLLSGHYLVYTGVGQGGSHTFLAGRLEILLAKSVWQAMPVVVAKVLAYYWSFRFLTCHHGLQHPLAFIEGLIGECVMPEGLCWLTTLEVVEERNWTKTSCIPCAFFPPSQEEPVRDTYILSLYGLHNNSKDGCFD